MNQEELIVFRRELQRSHWGEVLGLVEASTVTNLDALLNDLDELLAEKPLAPPQRREVPEDTNPFSALFSIRKWFTSVPSETGSAKPTEPLHPDRDIERVLRSFALMEARTLCLKIYEQQKQICKLPNWQKSGLLSMWNKDKTRFWATETNSETTRNHQGFCFLLLYALFGVEVLIWSLLSTANAPDGRVRLPHSCAVWLCLAAYSSCRHVALNPTCRFVIFAKSHSAKPICALLNHLVFVEQCGGNFSFL